MGMIDIVRAALDASLGNAGAVRNCRTELASRRDAERRIDAVCRRVPPPPERASA